MRKKSLIIFVLSILSAFFYTAHAEEPPKVFINSSLITFADQQPVIMGEGHTLVPARGVFEAMGADVTWDDDAKTVGVLKNDTRVTLTVGGDIMTVENMADASEKSVTLDISPMITQDTGRTMIPLRAISEAVGADVAWDGDTQTITITTADADASSENVPACSLSSDKTEAAKDETVDIFVEVKNLPENSFVSCVTATLLYPSEHFEFIGAQLVNDSEPVDKVTSGVNTKLDDRLKAVFVTVDKDTALSSDGKALKLTFRSLDGTDGTFALSNGYNTELGYDTFLRTDSADAPLSTLFEGINLKTDTTALTVTGAK